MGVIKGELTCIPCLGTCPEGTCTNPPFVTFDGKDRTVDLTGATGQVNLALR